MLLGLYVRATTLAWGVRDKFTREDGAVATEYGLLLVLIAIAIILAVGLLGTALKNIFTHGSQSLCAGDAGTNCS